MKSSLKTIASKSFRRSKSQNEFDIMTIQNEIVTKPPNNYLISQAKYRILNILNHLLDGFDSNHYVFYLFRRELNPMCFRKTFAYQKYHFNDDYKSEYTNKVFFNHTQDTNLDGPVT